MKRFSGTNQTIVRVPVIVEPIEVQVPALTIPIEVRDVAVAVGILPDLYKTPSAPLPIEYSLGCIVFGA